MCCGLDSILRGKVALNFNKKFHHSTPVCTPDTMFKFINLLAASKSYFFTVYIIFYDYHFSMEVVLVFKNH